MSLSKEEIEQAKNIKYDMDDFWLDQDRPQGRVKADPEITTTNTNPNDTNKKGFMPVIALGLIVFLLMKD